MSFLGGLVGGAVNGITHLAGNVGSTVKKAVVDTGHAVGRVASDPRIQMLTAAALAATGVGALPAAAMMAAERGGGALIKPGGNIGDGLKGAATGAAMGYGASKLGDMVYNGLGSVGSGSGLAASGGGGILSGLSDRAKSIAMSSLTGGASGSSGSVAGGGATSGVGGAAGGGGSSILDKLLLGGTVAAGAMDAADQKALRDKAADAATGSYDERAPLRARALALLNNPVTPNKSAIFANPGNPYDRQRRAAMLAQSAVPSSSSASPSVLPS